VVPPGSWGPDFDARSAASHAGGGVGWHEYRVIFLAGRNKAGQVERCPEAYWSRYRRAWHQGDRGPSAVCVLARAVSHPPWVRAPRVRPYLASDIRLQIAAVKCLVVTPSDYQNAGGWLLGAGQSWGGSSSRLQSRARNNQ